MSEPRQVAEGAEEVVPGIWYWHVEDDRIGDFISSAHAVVSNESAVLIDPVRLAPEALAGLGEMTAICLTSGGHQRSAWRYRRELGATVYAPALAQTLEEDADVRYGEGDLLPGALRAVFTPGAGTTQHTFLLEKEPVAAFVPDLLSHAEDEALELVPAQYMHDPEQARRSVESLLTLQFSLLCLSHGTPIVDDPHAAIRAALEV